MGLYTALYGCIHGHAMTLWFFKTKNIFATYAARARFTGHLQEVKVCYIIIGW